MTPGAIRNLHTLEQAEARLRDLAAQLGRDLTRDEAQAEINRLNSQLDATEGIVAGDGCYYPRRLPDGTDPFNL